MEVSGLATGLAPVEVLNAVVGDQSNVPFTSAPLIVRTAAAPGHMVTSFVVFKISGVKQTVWIFESPPVPAVKPQFTMFCPPKIEFVMSIVV